MQYPPYQILRNRMRKSQLPSPTPWRVLSREDLRDYSIKGLHRIVRKELPLQTAVRHFDKRLTGLLDQKKTPYCTFYGVLKTAYHNLHTNAERAMFRAAFDSPVEDAYLLRQANEHFARAKSNWSIENLLPATTRFGGFTLRMGMRALRKGITLPNGKKIVCHSYYRVPTGQINQTAANFGACLIGFMASGRWEYSPLHMGMIFKWDGRNNNGHAMCWLGGTSIPGMYGMGDNTWGSASTPTLFDERSMRSVREAWYPHKVKIV